MEEDNCYKNGKIYRIYIPGLEEFCYIGSTVIPLNDRLRAHRASAKSKGKYKFASEPMFKDDGEPTIELIEAFPCASKQELLAKEREVMERFPNRVNKNPSLLDDEERVEHHKEAVNRYCQTEKGKETRKKCKKEWDEANKEHTKAYLEANREKIRQQERDRKKEMTPEEKEAFLEKRRQNKNLVIVCSVCGVSVKKGEKWRHDKKHTQ